MPSRRMPRIVAPVAAALLLAGCAPGGSTGDGADVPAEVAQRLDAIDAAVSAWQAAGDLESAQRSAEDARNLIEGPGGPDYGDGDGDGTVAGATEAGLLPGLGGEPGLAQPPLNDCVERDVLGGSWDDPQRRWDVFADTLAAWSPGNNTMPTLPSHPQRVVGWATLTLESGSLDEAHEYAGHARLHVDISRAAYESCPG
ncbi:hypothetical protein GCM10022200_29600 [Microbacterium awajiense]|uniref:Uncharacterized protein n=1 Tax=Microbacterium awajiense TaxID=415214 RepID=A0ABP7AZR7_9MICO